MIMTLNTEPIYIAVLLESGNGGGHRKTWLTLPAGKKRFTATLDRIQAKDGDFFIADYTHRVPGMSRRELRSNPLALVNFLAARLRTLYDSDIEKLCAIWDTDHYFNTVGELIDFTFNTHEYRLKPGVRDAEALGNLYLGKPEKIAEGMKHSRFIDRHEYGTKLAERENGLFSPHGYVTSNIGWDLPVTERRVPEHLNLKGWLGEDLYGDWEADYIV